MTSAVRLATRVLYAMALLAASNSPVHACTCEGGRAPCESFWTTPAVFSGVVLDIRTVSGSGSVLGRLVRFQVDRAWRGDVSGVIDLYTDINGAACGYEFEPGKQYLVYANSRNGRLSVSLCSRTRPLADAGEDLAYFKTAFQPSAMGRIFGFAKFQSQKAHEPERPVTGYVVLLRGFDREWKTTTDADGRYEFRVPAGKYRIELVVPATEQAYGPRDLELGDARGCARGDFSVGRAGV